MTNQGKEEEYIRQFISELGTMSPSVGFHKSILEKINSRTSLTVYKPVISSLAWKIIGSTLVILFITVFLFAPNGSEANSLFSQLPDITYPELAISLPKISVPVINLPPIVLQSLISFIILASLAFITTLRKWKIS
ncbi:hypothetical protein [Algoriphagus yeomjeoni]|uniref:Uncharacterized protein n=1 Tax=Algoriphagus yeomjeoni TaxID=291403 RepID=A0A327PD77_9BACT|nr:hypothetical protein [Algoriphagus yeomjeoni]RAI90155.1 hypothetical protein LV83_02164 [Algoriphagus yeomjeoni]